MDEKFYYLLITVIAGLVILAGLIVTIFGVIKKRKLLIVLGVSIALIPTLISYLWQNSN